MEKETYKIMEYDRIREMLADLVEAGVGGLRGLHRGLLQVDELFSQRVDLPGDDPADEALHRADARPGRGGRRRRDGPEAAQRRGDVLGHRSGAAARRVTGG